MKQTNNRLNGKCEFMFIKSLNRKFEKRLILICSRIAIANPLASGGRPNEL